MRRDQLWYVLALVWWCLAAFALLRRHRGPAILEAAFATGFLILGILIGRRDKARLKRRRKLS
ncbi:MAG: hypothetical protein ACR2JE_06355 [Acidobacteriaceae bacterium]